MISDQTKQALLHKYAGGSMQLIKKSFALLEGFDSGRLSTELAAVFTAGNQPLKTTVMFADLASFSTKVQKMSALEVRSYLDKYYHDAIPAIYDNGGEIEKLIGDGIIAVFGPPFCDFDAGLDAAIKAAIHLVRAGIAANRSIKIALRSGSALFTYVGDDTYREATMIGQVLTELFRLEGVSLADSIATYSGTEECVRLESFMAGLPADSGRPTYLVSTESESVDLRGVDFDAVQHFRWKYRAQAPLFRRPR